MKISVAMCTYNGAKYISEQLESILHQTLVEVDEIIICDDGSTDNTIQIIEKLRENNTKIVLYQNEMNLGSTKNFEKAIQLTTGDYIFLSDQDDIWKKDKVVKTIDIFNQNLNAEVVFTNADVVDENSLPIPNITIWDLVFFYENELPKPIDFFDLIAKNGNVVTGATVCFKKELKPFLFPFSSHVLHDEWIAMVSALKKSLVYSTEKLISYRVHNNQQVGMKNLKKEHHLKRKKEVLLGIKQPKSFKEYRYLLKKSFLKKTEIQQYKKYNFSFINFDILLKNSDLELKLIREKMKKKHPFQYYFTSLLDTILGKRK